MLERFRLGKGDTLARPLVGDAEVVTHEPAHGQLDW
jgi:hypothetical protein